ncbi:hypothetical protein OnM2_025100 [Erysiphe neolycopersici]|uniref:Uncharacterized protein n=1 Tax=Erysiphe neolycopersici TaxID=212602 RepID=A0A420I146_9PEZI|nr:hypothetical protein OnM2_025100 [Erysiphe neolycopersici]
MCHQHIRFAEHRDYKRYDAMNLLKYLRVHKGRDRDCDLVLNATKNISANEGIQYGMDYGHTIFSREAGKVEIPRIPHDWVESHKDDCQT